MAANHAAGVHKARDSWCLHGMLRYCIPSSLRVMESHAGLLPHVRSHEELMEQLESTNRDLQLATERNRSLEAQHLAATREVETQRTQIAQLKLEAGALEAALKQK
jgi:hypothetical protein